LYDSSIYRNVFCFLTLNNSPIVMASKSYFLSHIYFPPPLHVFLQAKIYLPLNCSFYVYDFISTGSFKVIQFSF
jgi:hypothetical protein